VIDQEPVLIDATFRENIDILHRYSDDDLVKVLKECNLFDFVEKRGGLSAKI
jgi:ABC-type multidrug transport system fused ATPase/permease subunit